IRVEYLPEARCAIATYADGATATYFHDGAGTPTEVVERSGGTIRYECGPDGRLVTEVDPLGNATQLLYDTWGGNFGRVDPLENFYPPSHVEPNPPDPLAYILPQTSLEWEHGNLVDRARIVPPDHDDPVLESYPAKVYNSILGLTTEVA